MYDNWPWPWRYRCRQISEEPGVHKVRKVTSGPLRCVHLAPGKLRGAHDAGVVAKLGGNDARSSQDRADGGGAGRSLSRFPERLGVGDFASEHEHLGVEDVYHARDAQADVVPC